MEIKKFNCEYCGKNWRRKYSKEKIPKHFFCSVKCQNEWQKTREDLQIRNRNPEFRIKVSQGLKKRKIIMGDNYHSKETKRKIGVKTKEHWINYTNEQKNKIIDILKHNGTIKRKNKPYDYDWNKISQQERLNSFCHMCGTRNNLIVHHIIPVKYNGNRDKGNLVVLCNSCHRKLHYQLEIIEKIISDWEIIRILLRERLYIK